MYAYMLDSWMRTLKLFRVKSKVVVTNSAKISACSDIMIELESN